MLQILVGVTHLFINFSAQYTRSIRRAWWHSTACNAIVWKKEQLVRIITFSFVSLSVLFCCMVVRFVWSFCFCFHIILCCIHSHKWIYIYIFFNSLSLNVRIFFSFFAIALLFQRKAVAFVRRTAAPSPRRDRGKRGAETLRTPRRRSPGRSGRMSVSIIRSICAPNEMIQCIINVWWSRRGINYAPRGRSPPGLARQVISSLRSHSPPTAPRTGTRAPGGARSTFSFPIIPGVCKLSQSISPSFQVQTHLCALHACVCVCGRAGILISTMLSLLSSIWLLYSFIIVIIIICYLADAFVQSDLQLIRLNRGQSGVKALLKGPTAVRILLRLHWGLSYQPSSSHVP